MQKIGTYIPGCCREGRFPCEFVGKCVGKNCNLSSRSDDVAPSGDYLHAVRPSVNKSPVVFSYILDRDERKADIVQAVSKKLNLPVEEGNVKTYYIKSGRCDINDCVYPSVDSWINKLNRSEFVVTDSFHGWHLRSYLINRLSLSGIGKEG